MIFDRLDSAALYAALSPRIAAGLAYLAGTCFDDAPDGRVDIDGENVFALIQHYTSKPPAQGRWEAHRRYLDIQYVAAGTERFGIGSSDEMQLAEELADKDLLFFEADGSGQFITIRAGEFALVYPHEAHMPGLAADSPAEVTKVVVKVLVE